MNIICENTFKKENHNTTMIGSFDFKNEFDSIVLFAIL